MVEKFVQSDKGHTYYQLHEKTGGGWLVMLHGLTADHTLFDRQVEHFKDRYNIIVWDAPAHGKSRPYGEFSYGAAAAELKAILDAEGVTRAVFIGQSMGGYVTQSFLLRWPEYVAGFVGIDTCPYGEGYYSPSDRWWLRQIEWMAKLYPHKALVNAVANNCTATEYGRRNMAEALSHYEKNELCHLMGVGFSGFLAENRDMNISCPVLIIVGEKDRTGKVIQYCNAWHEKTGYKLVTIANAAHNSNADAPEAVNGAIEDFLRQFD